MQKVMCQLAGGEMMEDQSVWAGRYAGAARGGGDMAVVEGTWQGRKGNFRGRVHMLKEDWR